MVKYSALRNIYKKQRQRLRVFFKSAAQGLSKLFITMAVYHQLPHINLR